MAERARRTASYRTTLVLAGVAVASVLLKFLLDASRRSDDCGAAITDAITVTIWVALVSAGLALVFGIVALTERSGGARWIVAAMMVALIVLVPIVTATTWGLYVCSSGAA